MLTHSAPEKKDKLEKNPFGMLSEDRGSISLWFSLSLPVLILLFFYLFISLTVSYNVRRSTQSAGDISARAAALEINMDSLLIPTGSDPVPKPQIDAALARNTAIDYLKENLTPMNGFYSSNLSDLIESSDLAIGSDGRPLSDTAEGVAIEVINDDGYVNPANGQAIHSPAVLIVIQLRTYSVMTSQIVTTYSVSSL